MKKLNKAVSLLLCAALAASASIGILGVSRRLVGTARKRKHKACG